MGAVSWTLRAVTFADLVLDDATKAQARALAGEKAVELTGDRESILVAAAVEIEQYAQRAFWRGAAGVARGAVSIVNVHDATREAPMVPALPFSEGVSLTSVERWDDALADWALTTAYTVRPAARLCFETPGVYQVTADVLPAAVVPRPAREGLGRLFSYRENNRPVRGSGAMTDSGLPPTQAGGVMRSGAAEILRHYPRILP